MSLLKLYRAIRIIGSNRPCLALEVKKKKKHVIELLIVEINLFFSN